ncbi:MAG: sel1 repeat family protein, partial [Maritimibacter sp.]|nr:sel1 repeat family protein [Maritimibacter sp.]
TREDADALPVPTRPELLEALAAAVLTPPSRIELTGGELGPDDLVQAALPGEHEEPRETDLAALVRMTGGGNAVLEAAAAGEYVAPDLAFADVTEEIVTGDEAAVLAALAADPQAAFEEKSMTDPNQIACLDIMGEPFAGVPANDAEKTAVRAKLVEAAPACVAAAEGPRAAPEVLFFAGEIALARGDFPGAFGLYERAAAEGVGAANTRLADFYVYGAPPVSADSAQAAARLEAGAAAGDPQAMTVLALMHGEGSNVPQNTARMIELLTAAAEDGYHFAQYRLAKAYLDGEGVPGRADPALGIPDPARAASWFTRAADAGNLEAALELAGLYGDPNSGLPENPAEQARLTQLVADTGLPSAIAAMGVLYETGRGVERLPARAAALYIEALETGEVGFEDLRKGAPFEWDYDTAVAFQDALTARGVYNGGSDGIVGAGTRAAAERLTGG